jgi:hypothetical protein
MNNTLIRFIRALVFTALALIGGAMALLFMVSTALAVGLLYVVAKIRGRPFGMRAYWHPRNTTRGASAPLQTVRSDVIDVEVREVR